MGRPKIFCSPVLAGFRAWRERCALSFQAQLTMSLIAATRGEAVFHDDRELFIATPAEAPRLVRLQISNCKSEISAGGTCKARVRIGMDASLSDLLSTCPRGRGQCQFAGLLPLRPIYLGPTPLLCGLCGSSHYGPNYPRPMAMRFFDVA